MRHGNALLGLGAAQAALALVNMRAWLVPAVALVAWSGLSFLFVGAAYRRRAPGVFGKRGADGRLGPLAVLLCLPYLLLSWGLWRVEGWLSRERRYDEAAPGLFLGRRPASARALPPGVTLVADLTAEFPACRAVAAQGRAYRCLPMLDGTAPSDETTFRAFVAEIAEASARGPVYVHCAQGHGRSALVAAAVLLERGLAADPDAALASVRAARPRARLSREQYALLERLYTT